MRKNAGKVSEKDPVRTRMAAFCRRIVSFVRRGLRRCGEIAFRSKKITENRIGKTNSLDYELWKDYGDVSMTVYRNGRFDCCWDRAGNVLFRTGRKFNSRLPHEKIGEIAVDYEADYEPQGTSFLSVYGWTRWPLAEYYIVDNWGGIRWTPGEHLGTVEADGGVYDVYRVIMRRGASIDGTTDFPQFRSVRREKRSSGHVSVSEHFRAWEKLGIEMGGLYEVSLCVEGVNHSSGRASVTENRVSIRKPQRQKKSARKCAPE